MGTVHFHLVATQGGDERRVRERRGDLEHGLLTLRNKVMRIDEQSLGHAPRAHSSRCTKAIHPSLSRILHPRGSQRRQASRRWEENGSLFSTLLHLSGFWRSYCPLFSSLVDGLD